MLPTGTQTWIIAGVTVMHCGFDGLASKVLNTFKDDLFSGHILVFRGRSGKMVKVLILWVDRSGLSLFTKYLDWGRYVCPMAHKVKVHLTSTQFSMFHGYYVDATRSRLMYCFSFNLYKTCYPIISSPSGQVARVTI